MSQFRDNSWPLKNPFKMRQRILSAADVVLWENMLSNTRSKSVLKSLRCRSSGRSKSRSKSSVDVNKIYADNVSSTSSSAHHNDYQNVGQVQLPQITGGGGGSPKQGYDVDLNIRQNVWESQNKRHSIDATGGYSQHLGGPYGNSPADRRVGGVYTFRF